MDFNLILPIILILGVVYTIKSVVDAGTRRRIIAAHGSEALVRSLLDGDASKRRQSALHGGRVLVAVALGFGLIDLLGINEVTPGAIALLLGATGLGNLAYYLLERRVR